MKPFETILIALYLNDYITFEEYKSGIISTNRNVTYFIPVYNVFNNKDTEELYSTIKDELKERLKMYSKTKEILSKLINKSE